MAPPANHDFTPVKGWTTAIFDSQHGQVGVEILGYFGLPNEAPSHVRIRILRDVNKNLRAGNEFTVGWDDLHEVA